MLYNAALVGGSIPTRGRPSFYVVLDGEVGSSATSGGDVPVAAHGPGRFLAEPNL